MPDGSAPQVPLLAFRPVSKRFGGRAHQIPCPFGRMTVQQNVLVPTHTHQRSGRTSERYTQEILATCGLLHKAHQMAATLPLLDLKRLAGRARLLLLDEVAAGLVGPKVEEIMRLIASVHANGMTIILVERVQAVIQMSAILIFGLQQQLQNYSNLSTLFTGLLLIVLKERAHVRPAHGSVPATRS